MRYCLFIIILIAFSCKEDEQNRAIPVYNQAYQENFEADNITDIQKEAKDAYVLIDPFLENVHENITRIKSNNNEVGAYMSVGTGEEFREDFNQMEPFLVSKEWGQWPGEYFVNSTNTGIIDLMKMRIDKIDEWGCDWVEFDNMDWAYDQELRNTYGFEVTEQEGVAYYQELCQYVQSKGMKCMAKNLVENASEFDGVLYESYDDEQNWWNQAGAQRFLDQEKLVIINHYNESDCEEIYEKYKDIYNEDISFICEDASLKKYVHFNQ